MAKARKLTANQKAYRKEVQRLKQAIRRAEKKGYVFEEDALPAIPKRVTKKALQRIQETKPKDLYKKAVKLDLSTGEVIPALEARQIERKQAAQKAVQTRKLNQAETGQAWQSSDFKLPDFSKVVITNFKAHIAQFNTEASSMLRNWIDALIAKFGEGQVATMLNDGAESGNIVTYQIVYKQEALLEYMSNMMDYLPDVGEFTKQEMTDAFEYGEDWELPE